MGPTATVWGLWAPFTTIEYKIVVPRLVLSTSWSTAGVATHSLRYRRMWRCASYEAALETKGSRTVGLLPPYEETSRGY